MKIIISTWLNIDHLDKVSNFSEFRELPPNSSPILIAVDEILERRRGKKIKAKGVYLDAVRSGQSSVVTSFG
jgi:hypothetical protein